MSDRAMDTSGGLGHRDVRRPAQPAVHRRLRDARLGRRRGGRPPGDLAALGRRRPRHGARPARVPGPDHDAPGADPAAHAAPAQGVVRRPVVARAVAHHARRRRGRRAGRQRLDGDAAGAGDAHPDRAGGVRAARGVRPGLRRDRGGRRQDTGGGPADRTPGAGPRRGPPTARSTSPRPTTRDALEAFQRAVETGDLQGLLDILAPDVVLLGDGGGVAQAARVPVVGAGKVAGCPGSRIPPSASLHPARGQRPPGAGRPVRRCARHRARRYASTTA